TISNRAPSLKREELNGLHRTRCWREMDSNHRSLSRRSRFLLRKANCGGSNGGSPKKLFLLWGTDGSNPSPSRGESANPRSLPKSAPGYKVARGFVIQNKYTDAPVRVPRCDREPRQRHALI